MGLSAARSGLAALWLSVNNECLNHLKLALPYEPTSRLAYTHKSEAIEHQCLRMRPAAVCEHEQRVAERDQTHFVADLSCENHEICEGESANSDLEGTIAMNRLGYRLG